jgi:exonuclease SbcD
MFRFLHLSDTHVDYKPQLEYIENEKDLLEERLRGLKQAIVYAKNNNIHTIIHAGDVFNTPVPKLNYVYELEKIFADAEKDGIDFIIISGNHDQSKVKTAFNSLNLFKVIKNVKVFTDDTIIEKDGFEFFMIPAKYNWSKIKDTFPTSLNNLLTKSKTNKRILITHIPISSAKETATFDIETASEGTIDVDVIPDIFLYVALGHYHSMQQIGNRRMYYSGSTSQLSFNEEFEKKYFLDVTIDEQNNTNVTPIEIVPEHPLHTILIDASYVSNTQDFMMLLKHELEVNNTKYQLHNKILRIIISKLIAHVRLNLDREKIINTIKIYKPFGIKIEIERERIIAGQTEEIEAHKLIGTPREEIDSFLEKSGRKNSLINEVNEEIFEKAREKGDIDDY